MGLPGLLLFDHLLIPTGAGFCSSVGNMTSGSVAQWTRRIVWAIDSWPFWDPWVAASASGKRENLLRDEFFGSGLAGSTYVWGGGGGGAGAGSISKQPAAARAGRGTLRLFFGAGDVPCCFFRTRPKMQVACHG